MLHYIHNFYFAPFVDAASIVAAKKEAIVKKKVTKSTAKKPVAKPAAKPAAKPVAKPATPAPAAAPAPALEPVLPPEPEIVVQSLLTDATVNCGDYNETLHANDDPNTADYNIQTCVQHLIQGMAYEFSKSTSYPEVLITRKLGPKPFLKKSEPGYKLWGFYFDGNAVLKHVGYKFTGTPPCYGVFLQDYRENTGTDKKWHVQAQTYLTPAKWAEDMKIPVSQVTCIDKIQ